MSLIDMNEKYSKPSYRRKPHFRATSVRFPPFPRARAQLFFFLTRKTPLLTTSPPPQTHNGGAVVLKLRARLNPAHIPRGTPVIEVLSPKLRAHKSFWERRRYEMREPPRGFFSLFSDWKKNALLSYIGRPRKT
jgi:hypothetical protein